MLGLMHCPADMKRISVEAWHELQQRCGGGPELRPSDTCAMCLLSMLDTVTSADEQGQAREAALAMAEGLEDQDANPGSSLEAYFVSKTWLRYACQLRGAVVLHAAPIGLHCPAYCCVYLR